MRLNGRRVVVLETRILLGLHGTIWPLASCWINITGRKFRIPFNRLTEGHIALMHASHGSIDSRLCIESRDSQVLKRSEPKHARVLENGILLINLRTTSIEKSNQVRDCHSAVKNLTTDKNVQWRP